MGRFTGIENAKVTERLQNLSIGQYVLQVDAVKVVESRGKGDMFISEFTVLSSKGEGANPEGSRVSTIIPLRLDMALPNIKAFVAALTGEDLKAVTEKMVDTLVSAKNPAKGTVVRADAFEIQKKDGSPFTKVAFMHVTPDEAAKLAASA